MKAVLIYFKQSGKYYSEAEDEGCIGDFESLPLFRIWEYYRIKAKYRNLPGLVKNHSDYIIHIEVPGHRNNHPHIIMPKSYRDLKADNTLSKKIKQKSYGTFGTFVTENMAFNQNDDPSEHYFPITAICKSDMRQYYFSSRTFGKKSAEERIETMSFAEMKQLAEMMADDYLEQLFYGSMSTIFEDKFVKEKEKENEWKKS